MKLLQGLAPDTYYWPLDWWHPCPLGATLSRVEGWQIRADTYSGSTYGDNGTWWSFTVSGPPAAAAGPDDDAPTAPREPAVQRERPARRAGRRRRRGPRGPRTAAGAEVTMGVNPAVGGRLRGGPRAGGGRVRGGVLALLLLAVLLLPGRALAQGQTAVEYYHLDALGSVRAVTNAAGQVIRQHDFDPFGAELAVTFPNADRKLFTGHERDSETSLDHFGARYYRADLGRFTTVDPVGGRLADPQTLNRYAYARNNPLRYVDPTGMYEVDAGCLKDKKCSAEAARFERERLGAAGSKDAAIAAAAAAYGALGEANGVTVNFGNSRAVEAGCGKGAAGCVTASFVGDAATGEMNPVVNVLIGSGMSGTDFQRAIVHEGSHVGDDLAFIRSWDLGSRSFDAAKNFTRYATEFRAYQLETGVDLTAPHSLRGPIPAETARRIDTFLRDPGGIYFKQGLNRLILNPEFTKPR